MDLLEEGLRHGENKASQVEKKRVKKSNDNDGKKGNRTALER
jgi:hypothetical protein